MSVAIRRLRGNARRSVNTGAFGVGFATGMLAYWNYRFTIKKEFLIGHGLHRFSQQVTNYTPYDVQWLTFYRMPWEEYKVHHLFSPYSVIGQIDYSKEVLIPKTKTVGGKSVVGFDVLNPLYCYDAGKINLEALSLGKKDQVSPPKYIYISSLLFRSKFRSTTNYFRWL